VKKRIAKKEMKGRKGKSKGIEKGGKKEEKREK